jgi:hypothetical protein
MANLLAADEAEARLLKTPAIQKIQLPRETEESVHNATGYPV